MYGAYTQKQQGFGQLNSFPLVKERLPLWQSPQNVSSTPSLVVRDHATGATLVRSNPSANVPVPAGQQGPTRLQPLLQTPVSSQKQAQMQPHLNGPVFMARPQARLRPLASSGQPMNVVGMGPNPNVNSSLGAGESPAKRQRPLLESSYSTGGQPLFASGQYTMVSNKNPNGSKPTVKPLLPSPTPSSSSGTSRTSGSPVIPRMVQIPMISEFNKTSVTDTSDDKATIEAGATDDFLFPDLPKDEDIDLEDVIFDCHYYHDRYAEVRKECGDDRKKLRYHWDHTGIDKGFSCSPVLDLSYFITKIPMEYQTRQLNYRVAYRFFLRHVSDRLASSELYNPVSYVQRYPQLQRYTAKQLILHYISIGRFNKLNAAASP